MIRTSTMIAALISIFALTTQAADPVQFKFLHQKGRVTTLKIVTKSVGSMKMGEAIPEQKFTQIFEQGLKMTCLKVNPDKTVVYDMVLPYVAMNMNMGGMQMNFDSRNVDPSKTDLTTKMLGTMFSVLIEKHFELEMDEHGKMTKITGMKEAFKEAFAKVEEEAGSPQVSQMFQQMDSFFDDDAWMEQMEGYNRFVPTGKTARIGDTWTREWTMKLPPMGAEMVGKGKYELLAVEEFHGRPCAKIAIHESFQTTSGDEAASPKANDPDAAPNPFAGMKMDLKASNGKGIAYVDYAKGDIVQLRQTQRMKIEITLPSTVGENEIPPGFGQIAMSLNNSTSLDLIDNGAFNDASSDASSDGPKTETETP